MSDETPPMFDNVTVVTVADDPMPAFENNSSEGKPKRGRPRKSASTTTTTYKAGQFVDPLTELYASVGALLIPFDDVCGRAVLESSTRCAESLDALARENEMVRRALTSLTKTSALAGVVIAHAPIIMAVASHHLPAFQNDDKADGDEDEAPDMNALPFPVL